MDKANYFSRQSDSYAAFRPTYPDALYRFIYQHVKSKSCAWDCGTGNGQIARHLANDFDRVYATDVSEQQLKQAFQAENIFYSVSAAEHTSFEDKTFDLITVGQALHWFDLQAFYEEVRRTSKVDGLIAVWGYALLSVEPVIDKLFLDFYNNTVGPYWDDARKLVEDHYRGIPFPFQEIPCPAFYIRVQWTSEHFTGYLSSWSATQRYIRAKDTDPVISFRERLLPAWKPREVKEVTFPVFMKLGKV